MSLCDHTSGRIQSALAWQYLDKASLALKRALDSTSPFNFVNEVKRGSVLLVGEGNLTFSLSLSNLAAARSPDLICTTFEPEADYSEVTAANAARLRRKGIRVISNIDATSLTKWFARKSFDLIVFQFPNVGSRIPVRGRNPNHQLVRSFLKSAGEHQSAKGNVVITAVNSPHYDGAFDMSDAAARNNFEEPTAHPFYFSDYPGYIHTKTKEDGESALNKDDEFVTYVFRKKSRRSNRWIS